MGCGRPAAPELAPEQASRPIGSARAHRLAAAPGGTERYCAWFGARDGEVLVFGESAFWPAFREADADPEADLRAEGPRRVGRFDLRLRRFLPPLDVPPAAGAALTGTWDVLAHPNGRLYFSSLFEASGAVDPRSGTTLHFDSLGPGLNELALGPGGRVIASRYGGPDGGPGSIVVFDADGSLWRELPLLGPAGYSVAPKTVAWDPVREEIWVTTDLLPAPDALGPAAPLPAEELHPLLVLDLTGRSRRASVAGEAHFVSFDESGVGYLAVSVDGRLELHRLTGGRHERLTLDPRFRAEFDFAQDLTIAGDGRVAVTRWSGFVHVVDGSRDAAKPRITTVRLPPSDPTGLYYTGVLDGDDVCATYCADIEVVCAPLGDGELREWESVPERAGILR